MTGRVFGGRYEIKDRIGIGGITAEVYRAKIARWAVVVAVKVMLPQFAADPSSPSASARKPPRLQTCRAPTS